MKRVEDKLKIFIGAFITVIVGISLLGSLGDSVNDGTTLSNIRNESMAFAAGGVTASAAQDDVVSITFFGNFTNGTVNDLTSNVNTLINFTKAGVITIDNATVPTGVTYNISYQYEDDEYVVHGTSRTLMPFYVLFFTIAILFVVVALFLKLKEGF